MRCMYSIPRPLTELYGGAETPSLASLVPTSKTVTGLGNKVCLPPRRVLRAEAALGESSQPTMLQIFYNIMGIRTIHVFFIQNVAKVFLFGYYDSYRRWGYMIQ